MRLTCRQGPYTAGAPDALAFNPLSLISDNAEAIIGNAGEQAPTDFLPPNLDPSIVDGYAAQKRSLVSRFGRDNVAAYEIINNNAGSLTVAVMHPFSRGTCYINSADPFQPPSIDPRWLSNPVDRQVLVEALLFNRRLLEQPSMQELKPTQFVPRPNADEAALNTVISGGLRTEFHPSGTLSMLPLEQGGVVDPHLIVYGTQNLRVVDASIYPLIPAAHLQAVVYGVAEKVGYCLRCATEADGHRLRISSKEITWNRAAYPPPPRLHQAPNAKVPVYLHRKQFRGRVRTRSLRIVQLRPRLVALQPPPTLASHLPPQVSGPVVPTLAVHLQHQLATQIAMRSQRPLRL